MKVVRYLHNRKTCISIVDDSWRPYCYFVTNYLNLYLGDIPPNTKEAKARELLFFLKWLDSQSIKIINRIECGVFLDYAECSSFLSTARLRSSELPLGSVKLSKKLTDKSISNLIFSSPIKYKNVQQSLTNNRVRAAISYLKFLSRDLHRKARNINNIESNCSRSVKFLKEGIRKTNLKCDFDPTQSLVPDEVMSKLLDCINPCSLENPFTCGRIRNSLIVKLLIETGIRRGALAKLKVSDFKFTGRLQTLVIQKINDDFDDPRSIKPSQKTRSHTSHVSPQLMREIEDYIHLIRSRFSASNTHEYVFVSEASTRGKAGQPLTLRSINKIFERLSSAISYRVYPHALRHKWNETFTEYAEKMGVRGEELDDLRRYAMGWQRSSDMPQIYNRLKLAEKVQSIHLANQSKLEIS